MNEVVNELVRISIDIELNKGEPPEKAIRIAIAEVLVSLARAIEHYDHDSPVSWFPLFHQVFPLTMSLKSQQKGWNFRIIGRIKNSFNGTGGIG